MKRNQWIYLVLAMVILVIWEALGSQYNEVRLLVSSPSYSLAYFKENTSMLLESAATTFFEALLGLIIATLLSFAAMIICFYQPRLMDFILPVMVSSQVVPLVTLAPFFILLFGIGVTGKVAMAAVMCFFPVFVNFAAGAKAISANVHELMYIYSAPKTFRIFRVYFPLSLPNIMAGLKVSATLSVIGAIVAEFSGAEAGLGKNLFIGSLRLEPELMMNSLILSSILGVVFFKTIRFVEAKLINWS